MKCLSGAVLAAISLAAPCAQAQKTDASGTDFSVGDIVVTATGMARSTVGVLTSIDVLGADIAQRQSVNNTWEMFARLPGVTLTDFDQGTTSGRFSIRGFNGEGEINAVKLLIDGIPANANDGGMGFIDMVMPLDIAGIELVRGTSDPRHGLHSIAGNANILTRIGGTYLDARALAGAYGTYEGQVSAGHETQGGFSQNYFVGYRDTQGYRDHADLDRLNLAGKWFQDMGRVRFGAIARYSRANAQEPGYLTEADASKDRRQSYSISETDGGKRRLQQYSLHLDADLGHALSLTAKGYANGYKDDRFVRFSENVSQQRRLTQEWQYGGLFALHYHPFIDGMHSVMIEAGGDFQIQDNESLRFQTNRRTPVRQTRDHSFDMAVYGGYVQAILEPTPWLKLTPAWRFDKVSGDFTDRLIGATYDINDYGTISQPKFSLAVLPAEGVTVYGNWGRTFQIGVGSGAYKVPPRDRDLDPSINEGWEAGVKYALDKWLTVRVALWKQTASGEFKRRLNDPSGDFDNLGKTRRRGTDVQVSLSPLPQVDLWAAWSRQRAIIAEPDPATPANKGNWIDHVPEHVFSGGIDYMPTEQLRFSLTGNGQSSYELAPDNATRRYGNYVVLNLEAAYQLTPAIELSAQVNNLANEEYAYVWYDGTQVLMAPAPKRAVYGAVRMRL